MFQYAYGFRFSIAGLGSLTQASSLKIVFVRPDGTTFSRQTPDLSIDDATTGVISFLVEQGDFVIPGRYAYQVIDTTEGRFYPSDIGTIEIRPNCSNLVAP